MSLLPLTPRQEQLLRIIDDSLASHGYAPTLQELARALKIASVQGVKDHLTALERKGYIRRPAGKRRAIEVVHHVIPLQGTIPILGRVAAGQPVLAAENQEGTLRLDQALLGSGSHFALRVQGDSMLGAGIENGDFVIVRQQETANSGEIIIALLGEEVTVKRLRKKGKAFFLEAANPAYPPIALLRHPTTPRILGKVVGLYRNLNQKH
ncbi:MAG TPA: transcriptional repressor LexA [Candidatus Binatia bacterium]|jgi:repressor LexA|nr:transcriptional repressor LexA [Candidatus Binatia bacterium]